MQRRKPGLANIDTLLMRVLSVRQATLEVTGSSRVRVHIDPAVWYIAVGLGHPGGADDFCQIFMKDKNRPKTRQGLGCSSIKVPHELGSVRRETVR